MELPPTKELQATDLRFLSPCGGNSFFAWLAELYFVRSYE